MQSYKVKYNATMIRNANRLVEPRGKNNEDSISKTDFDQVISLETELWFPIQRIAFPSYEDQEVETNLTCNVQYTMCQLKNRTWRVNGKKCELLALPNYAGFEEASVFAWWNLYDIRLLVYTVASSHPYDRSPKTFRPINSILTEIQTAS